jgi:hypothetical protein
MKDIRAHKQRKETFPREAKKGSSTTANAEFLTPPMFASIWEAAKAYAAQGRALSRRLMQQHGDAVAEYNVRLGHGDLRGEEWTV